MHERKLRERSVDNLKKKINNIHSSGQVVKFAKEHAVQKFVLNQATLSLSTEIAGMKTHNIRE